MNSKLGVGTTTPFAKLSIHAFAGETNTALFAVASSTASATTTLFVINNDGNVGIGTTSPIGILSVYGGNATFQNPATSTIAFQILGPASTTILAIDNSNLGTSTLSGFLNVTGANSTSTFSGALSVTREVYAEGERVCTNGNGVCAGGAQIASGWKDNGTEVVLRTITDVVGIGTNNPVEKLDVVGNLLVNGASSTITNLLTVNSTSTNATTSYLAVTQAASTSRLQVSNGFFQDGFSSGCTGDDGETVLYNASTGKFTCGTDQTAAVGSGSNWSFESQFAIRPTSTAVGILLTASSTFDKFFARTSTSTFATTSVLSISTSLFNTGSTTIGDASTDALSVIASSTFFSNAGFLGSLQIGDQQAARLP